MFGQPHNLLTKSPDGVTLTPLPKLLLERRATTVFKPDAVPQPILQMILELGAPAPSGYNLQPWRFFVVLDAENRKRPQRAAMDQPKVGEAPVVIIAIGMKEETKQSIVDVAQEGTNRGAGKLQEVNKVAEHMRQFRECFSMEVGVNRHIMIAVTTIILVAESFGYDAAPMEGFSPDEVKHEFGLPDEAAVLALHAISRREGPHKPSPGRFPLSRIVSQEHYGTPWEDSFDLPGLMHLKHQLALQVRNVVNPSHASVFESASGIRPAIS